MPWRLPEQREERNAYNRKWYRKNKKKFDAVVRKSYRKHREYELNKSHEDNQKLKFEVLLHYTRVFDSTATAPHCRDIFHRHLPDDLFVVDIDCLTVDHIDGGGSRHRKQIGNGHTYRWLKKHNYPSGYQVLCFNCNWKKRLKQGTRFNVK
jgi:hypothetical protein